MTAATIDFDDALRDPSSAFDEPKDVLSDDRLSRDQKIRLLEQWKYDAAELEVADDENMSGGEESMSRRVSLALSELVGAEAADKDAAHKQT